MYIPIVISGNFTWVSYFLLTWYVFKHDKQDSEWIAPIGYSWHYVQCKRTSQDSVVHVRRMCTTDHHDQLSNYRPQEYLHILQRVYTVLTRPSSSSLGITNNLPLTLTRETIPISSYLKTCFSTKTHSQNIGIILWTNSMDTELIAWIFG